MRGWGEISISNCDGDCRSQNNKSFNVRVLVSHPIACCEELGNRVSGVGEYGGLTCVLWGRGAWRGDNSFIETEGLDYIAQVMDVGRTKGKGEGAAAEAGALEV